MNFYRFRLTSNLIFLNVVEFLNKLRLFYLRAKFFRRELIFLKFFHHFFQYQSTIFLIY